MLRLKLRLLAIFALFGFAGIQAQTTRAYMAANPECTAGIYHSYHYTPSVATPAPKGYEPFYISHYGRHGSRWHASASTYNKPLTILRKAAEADALTEKGRDLLVRMEVIAADAEGRYGDLSPRGVMEHRGIAARMYASFPAIFSTRKGRECVIESRSTLVPRCILSMAAFNERLKELNPEIRATRESSARYMPYIGNNEGLDRQKPFSEPVLDSMMQTRLHPDRLLASLFSNAAFIEREIKKPLQLMEQLYQVASILQDVSYLNLSLYDIFTDEELYAAWEYTNAKRYVMFGPSKRFGDDIIADAKPLLRNIVETADRVITEGGLSASLRFGHDVNIIPLLALLQIEGADARVQNMDDVAAVWNDFRVTPMGTNLQFVFFRNTRSGDVLVKVLFNEREAKLPLDTDFAPYYRWADLKKYCKTRYE